MTVDDELTRLQGKPPGRFIMAGIPIWISLLTYFIIGINGVYVHFRESMTFCDSWRECRFRGGGAGQLPLASNVASLQGFMEDLNLPVQAAWVQEADVSSIQNYCADTASSIRCPGSMVLTTAMSELRPPIVNCTDTSVSLRICGNGKHFESNRIIRDFTTGTIPGGSFCDVASYCDTLGLRLPDRDGLINISEVRKTLKYEQISATWMISRDTYTTWQSFCGDFYTGQLRTVCPGVIVLHDNLSVISGDLLGCHLTLPVICDLPSALGYVVGGLVAAVVLILLLIVVTVIICIKKRSAKRQSAMQRPLETTDHLAESGVSNIGASISPENPASIQPEVGAVISYEPQSPDDATVYYSVIPDPPSCQRDNDYAMPTIDQSADKQMLVIPDEYLTVNPTSGFVDLNVIP